MKKQVLDTLHPVTPQNEHLVSPFMKVLLDKIVDELEPPPKEQNHAIHINEHERIYIIPLEDE